MTNNFFIFDYFGNKRIPLLADKTPEGISYAVIEEWVSYFECHKCGRWDYCKFAEPHPANPNRAVDIKCGVVKKSIENAISSLFPVVKDLPADQFQMFLDGLFHFVKFIFCSEQFIGTCMDSEMIDFYKEHAPMYFGQAKTIRDHLGMLAHFWKDISKINIKSSVIFLEGYSEKEFLDTMKQSNSFWFTGKAFKVYGGAGNRRTKRIEMLLKDYREAGFEVYIQGDADGSSVDIFNNLVHANAIPEKNTFVFHHDFETSIPPKMLHFILTDLGVFEDFDIHEFESKFTPYSNSIVKTLKEKLSIDISPYKMDIAGSVAEILCNQMQNWVQNEDFMKTELGSFLDFIIRMK